MIWIAELTLGNEANAVSHSREAKSAAPGPTSNLVQHLRDALARRRTRRALAELSDHQLRDIGLHRGAIDAASRGDVEPESAPRTPRPRCESSALPVATPVKTARDCSLERAA